MPKLRNGSKGDSIIWPKTHGMLTDAGEIVKLIVTIFM